MLARQPRQTDPFSKGKVQLRLPTKSPHDVETMVELPMDQLNLSPNLYGAIGRDTRRKLREESKERIWRRGKKNQPLTHDEPMSDEEARALEAELMKNSSYARLPAPDRLRRTATLLLNPPF